MDRHAVNDLIDSSLQRWYGSVSEWRSPQLGTEAGCVSCRTSEFAAFDRHWQWPHELVHSFVEVLEVVTTQVATAIHEECQGYEAEADVALPCSDCVTAARSTVYACALRHTHDVADVINECAVPRLSSYVRKNIDLALEAATRGEWAS